MLTIIIILLKNIDYELKSKYSLKNNSLHWSSGHGRADDEFSWKIIIIIII